MESRAQLNTIIEDALKVLSSPAEFYRNMSKDGGFADPLIFLLVMAVVMGLMMAILSLFGAGVIGAMAVGLGAVITIPIMSLIFSFIGAAILFVIWKLMGSGEDYQCAYRCVAYAAAIYPVTTLLGLIPYVGTIVGVVWGIFLMITASVEVHQVKRQSALVVFGIFGAILLIMNVSSEIAARKLASTAEQFSQQMEEKFGDIGIQLENMEEMTPEEAGEAVGGFLKGLSSAVEQAQRESNGEQAIAPVQQSDAAEVPDGGELRGMNGSEEMSAEEAGKALGEFFSGLEKATRELRQQAESQSEEAPAVEASSMEASSMDTAGEARAAE